MNFSSKTMRLNHLESTPYLTYKALEEIPFVKHAFSTRLGGVSKGVFESMNMAFNRGDRPYAVIENYKRLCASAGFEYESLVASAQDHHTVVRAVTAKERGIGIYRPRDMESVDALVTNDPEVTLVTYYADCTPLFFIDIVHRAVGLAHAGWKGTVGRIGTEVLKKMEECYATGPQDVVVAIGPAISGCCYEVNPPCAQEFLKMTDLQTDKFVFKAENQKYKVDMIEANRQILVQAGVIPGNIFISDLCTKCNSDLLWSHRATRGHRGTMCALLALK